VRAAVTEARGLLLPAAEGLGPAAAGLRAVRGLLGGEGPRTLVVAVMNNAEARGAGGYVPSVAVVRTDRGAVDVGSFVDTNMLDDPPETAVRVPAPAAFSERWGRLLADTTLWKNVTVSPHGPDVAAVLCELARARLDAGCDGVLLVDVPALAEVMSLGGPVQLSGETLEGEELVEALLVEAYAEAEDLGLAQVERRAMLLAAADGAVAQLLGERLTALPVLRLLGRTAAERRLVLWSAREQDQRALERAGLSGSVDPDGGDLSLVSLNQFSAGKLDYYLRREVAVDVEVGLEVARVEQRVRLLLDHPADLPRYVLGTKEGRLEHLVDLGLARGATAVQVHRDGEPQAFELVEDDRGAARVSFVSVLERGGSTELLLRYEVPLDDGTYRLEVLPQPLAQDASLDLSVRAGQGLVLADGPVTEQGPLARSRTVEVRAQRPSWWGRPVEVPW
jgi:hypothetical protein